MFYKLIHTTDDPVLASLRLVLGIVFFAHGAQKMLGWFGGPGYSGAMSSFTQTLGSPAFFAVLAILAEFLGGIGLIVGLLGRVAAFAIAVEMAVAVFMVHLQNGFFMNWTGAKTGEGFEYHLLAIAMASTIAVRGAGALSVDRAIELSQHTHPHAYPQPSRG